MGASHAGKWTGFAQAAAAAYNEIRCCTAQMGPSPRSCRKNGRETGSLDPAAERE